MSHSQLEPQYPTASDTRALLDQRAKQQQYYNRSAKDLPPISRGETIRMQLPGQTKWTPGVCTGQCGPRSYNVRVGDREFRRNRRQLLYTKEARPLEPPNIDPNVETPTASDGAVGLLSKCRIPGYPYSWEAHLPPQHHHQSNRSPVHPSPCIDLGGLVGLQTGLQTMSLPDMCKNYTHTQVSKMCIISISVLRQL